jgi:hypothetical protein
MEKYKLCPACGTKNAPSLLECVSCEADLTRVKVTDEETEKMLAEAAEAAAPQSVIRLCECGVKNPGNARKCSGCGEDISDITPIPDAPEEAPAKVSFILSSLDGQYAFHIPEEGITIGREQGMQEYLSKKPYVSRTQAQLTVEAGTLYIENLSKTNYTYVNNRRITEKTPLQDGDELGLGGTNIDGKCQEQAAYFLVRIGACS